MKSYTDKELAGFMLEMRQHGVRTRWRYLKTNKWRWILFCALILFLLALGTFVQAWGFVGLVVGLVAGTYSRDGVLLRMQRAAWPFYTRVLDWEKVERIASGESVA